MRILMIAALAATTFAAQAAAKPADPAAPSIVAGAGIAVAQTRSGKVQGFRDEGVETFRGVPYAKAERFMPPGPVAPWTGVRTALSYGSICPQPIAAPPNDIQTFISDGRYWPQAEDCQNLNIWTPALDGKKRPVMVWLHGGGYFSGSSHENNVYDGRNLSRDGDVVVVSINHRLNILGFLDLSAYGDQYKSSGDVGMMDIVASLQWVRDNIAAFGGDPANVTIFGQSGGGGKVGTLLAAPSAKGLFQKAVIESGVAGGLEPDDGGQAVTRRVAAMTLQNAGLQPGDVAALQALPYDRLVAAGAKALMDVSREKTGGGTGPLGFPTVNWGPVVDGVFLPEKPFGAAASPLSADVPLLIGSTLNEFQQLNPQLAGRAGWTTDDLRAYLKKAHGDKADAVLAAYQRAYPGLKPGALAAIDPMFRAGALRAARLKAKQPAPVYNYLFAWQSPVLDGFWAAGHSMEIAFVFDNVERGRQSTGGGAAVAGLSTQVSQAWINFARSGDPNHKGLPAWPRFTDDHPATMVFDTPSQVRVGHDADLISLLSKPGRP
jgi:para-nitrobenzyl esterase